VQAAALQLRRAHSIMGRRKPTLGRDAPRDVADYFNEENVRSMRVAGRRTSSHPSTCCFFEMSRDRMGPHV